MAEQTIQNVKLKIGTKAQFEEKKADLPVGTLVGITDGVGIDDLDSTVQSILNNAATSAIPNSTIDTLFS